MQFTVNRIILLSLLCLLWHTGSFAQGTMCDVFPLRLLDSVKIDGAANDWPAGIDKLWLAADPEGNLDLTGFDAAAAIGRVDSGLCLFAWVKDDHIFEEDAPLLRNDAIEIFISREKGAADMLQYIISPGITESFPEARINKVDYGTGTHYSLVNEILVAGEPAQNGYTVEIFIPYSVLCLEQMYDDNLALNFYINDADSAGSRPVNHGWHYYPSTYKNRNTQFLIQTGTGEKRPALVSRAAFIDTSEYEINLYGYDTPAGRSVMLQAGAGTFAEGVFTSSGTGAVANITFPKERLGGAAFIDAVVDGACVHRIETANIPQRYERLEKPHRLEEEIRLFEEIDKREPPETGAVLFLGSSSIRMWPGLDDAFPGRNLVQRGFGGSRTEDVLYFYDRIVTPYKPSVIVLFAGVNDINIGVSPDSVARNTRTFLEHVERDLPETKVIVLSTTVSVRRKALKEQYLEANELLRGLVNDFSFASFLDLVPHMMDERGRVNANLFGPDSTHMNASGYYIWQELISEKLDD